MSGLMYTEILVKDIGYIRSKGGTDNFLFRNFMAKDCKNDKRGLVPSSVPSIQPVKGIG